MEIFSASTRAKARVHDLLRLERPDRPIFIQFAGADLV
jgi:hypothetical protein